MLRAIDADRPFLSLVLGGGEQSTAAAAVRQQQQEAKFGGAESGGFVDCKRPGISHDEAAFLIHLGFQVNKQCVAEDEKNRSA